MYFPLKKCSVSISLECIYNTQHIHVPQIQVIYKRDPEESRMTYLNLNLNSRNTNNMILVLLHDSQTVEDKFFKYFTNEKHHQTMCKETGL